MNADLEVDIGVAVLVLGVLGVAAIPRMVPSMTALHTNGGAGEPTDALLMLGITIVNLSGGHSNYRTSDFSDQKNPSISYHSRQILYSQDHCGSRSGDGFCSVCS